MTVSINISNSLFEDNDEEFFECIGNDDEEHLLQSKRNNNRVSPKIRQLMKKYKSPTNLPNEMNE